MTSQKIENVLNLALDATQEERLRSGNLEVGYEIGRASCRERVCLYV